MTIFNHFIKFILIFLIVFTPIAFGSIELWAFSIMELGILLVIILSVFKNLFSPNSELRTPNSPPSVAPVLPGRRTGKLKTFDSQLNTLNSPLTIFLLSLFLLLILFQLLPLPSGLLKILSPKTYALRHQLLMTNDQLQMTTLSFFPLVTQVEFFKWLTLIGLFFLLLRSRLLDDKYRVTHQLIIAIMLIGVTESLYGMFEFFSGHKYILNLDMETKIASVTGTFINRNYFAGYLLMVIPLSVGFLFSREATQINRFRGWRERLVSFDGKTLLIGFCVIVMILGLLFSASRMGIASLLLAFTLLSLLFRSPSKEHRFSRTSILILGLALLWAAWIGLDFVISRFLTSSEDFKGRWVFWVNTFQIFKDFPIFGSGLGTFAWVFPMYRSFHLIGVATHAENDYLQLASEVGMVGIGLLLILFLFLLYKAISGIRSLSHRESVRYIGIGGLVGILALMFHSIVERNIQVPSNAFLYTILWAIVLRISLRGVNRRNDPINAISSTNAKQ
jgi:O-antigen ligase